MDSGDFTGDILSPVDLSFGERHSYGQGGRDDDPCLGTNPCPKPLRANPLKGWAMTCAGRRKNPGFTLDLM